MLKVICIFTLIVFCNGYINKYHGHYNQLVLNLSHPVTTYWLAHKEWPKENYRPNNIHLSDQTWDTLTTPNYWIISSFWPSKDNGNHPTYCFVGRPPVTIDPYVKSELRGEWPDYTKAEHEDEYWTNAWRRSGTCFLDLPDINDENDYFKKALSLLSRNNLGSSLKSSDVVSGRGYDIRRLNNVIRDNLGINAHLQCVEDENGKQYLFGGSLCFNKYLVREGCIKALHPTCDKNKLVYLPTLQKNKEDQDN